MIRPMRRSVGAFLRRDLAIAASYKVPFVLDLVAVLFGLLEFWFLSRIVEPTAVAGGYFPFVVVGLVATSFLAAGIITASMTLRQEQVQGTLDVLVNSGVRPWVLVGGLAAYPLLAAFVRAAILLALIVVIDPRLGITTADWGVVIVALGLGSACFVALGMVTSALVILFRQGAGAASWLMTMLVLIGGIAFPRSLLPGWLLPLSELSPLTQVLTLTRDALLSGLTWTQAFPGIATLVVMAAAYSLLGGLVVAAALRRARKTGTLSQY